MMFTTNNYNTIPPCNLDAEEEILGGIMLDSGAISRVVNLLPPEAFHFSIHQQIYKAALALYNQGLPTDFMSVTSWLHDHKLLEKVGGQPKIAQLLDSTVSAVNIDRYALLIVEKWHRREMIASGNELTSLASDTLNSFDHCISKAKEYLERIISLKSPEDKITRTHQRLITEIEAVELHEENPSLKYLKLKEIAKKFKLSTREIDEIWLKHLIYKEGAGELKTLQQITEETDDYTRWLMQGLLRSVGLTVLHAKGGAGKTTLAYDWLYCLATGKPWEGFPVTAQRRRVLIIQTDENKSDMIPTLVARGYEDGLDVKFVDRWNIQNSAAFNRYLKEFDPDVVLIDSLFSVSAGSLVTENDAEYARPLLVINKIAENYGKQVILIHHSNGEGGARGTGAITASATAVLSLAADPDHPGPDSPWRLLTIEKFRGRCLARYSLEFFAQQRRFIFHGEHKKQDESSSLKDRIISFLSAHRNTRYELEELMEFCSGALASVRRAAGQLAAAGIISSCRKSPTNRKMVYFLEWYGDDDDGGNDGGSDGGSDPPDHRIASGSFDDHSLGSFLEPSPQQDYSDLDSTSDPVITENQVLSKAPLSEENDDPMITPEMSETEMPTEQGIQPTETSDHFKDPLAIHCDHSNGSDHSDKKLKPGVRVRYQHWYGTLSSQNKKGWFIIWETVDPFTTKHYGQPPTQAIHPDELEVVL